VIADPGLTTAHRGLANRLDYQLTAVRQALDPDKPHPRILLVSAVGLGKVMIIAGPPHQMVLLRIWRGRP
jgi:hypothetical protein